MQASSLVKVESLMGIEETKLEYDAAEAIRSMESYSRIRAWVNFYDNIPELRWCVGAAQLQQVELSVAPKDLRIASAYRFARILSDALIPTSGDELSDLKQALSSGQPMLSAADTFKIPPLILTRYIIGTHIDSKSWQHPEQHENSTAAELIAMAKLVDNSACREEIWERREKLSMLEKALSKWCRNKGLKVITRAQLPRRDTPRPSLLVSKCSLNGKKISWFEVCPLYGLKNSAVEEVMRSRMAVMDAKYGSGCMLMPFQMDPNFASAWGHSVVVSFESLDSRFVHILHEVLDKPIFEVRCSFERMLSNWSLTAAPIDNATEGACFPGEATDSNAHPPKKESKGGEGDAKREGAEQQATAPVPAASPAVAPKPRSKGGRRAVRNFQTHVCFSFF